MVVIVYVLTFAGFWLRHKGYGILLFSSFCLVSHCTMNITLSWTIYALFKCMLLCKLILFKIVHLSRLPWSWAHQVGATITLWPLAFQPFYRKIPMIFYPHLLIHNSSRPHKSGQVFLVCPLDSTCCPIPKNNIDPVGMQQFSPCSLDFNLSICLLWFREILDQCDNLQNLVVQTQFACM